MQNDIDSFLVNASLVQYPEVRSSYVEFMKDHKIYKKKCTYIYIYKKSLYIYIYTGVRGFPEAP